MSIGRREALLRIGATGAVLGGASIATALLYDRGGFDVERSKEKPQTRDYRLEGVAPSLAIARNDPDPAALTRKAVDALGGMKRFISRGDVVVVKPNIGWDRAPIHAANTNPQVVAEVVKMAYDAGAKNVVVTDASCNEAVRCFERSGIWRACYELGAEIVFPIESKFKKMRLKGEVLDEWPVYSTLINADKVINVPVAKHHNLSLYTGAMKNWYGAIGGRRNRLHQNIDVSIADLATFMQPTLTVLDAVRVLTRNGPQGGNVADARDMNIVAASTDQVAIDAFGCTLIGRTASEIRYIGMAVERNLGTLDYASLGPIEV